MDVTSYGSLGIFIRRKPIISSRCYDLESTVIH